MKPNDRYRWILDFMTTGTGRYVDILYADFVVDYIEATGAPATLQMFGAPKCPQLGRDLAAMFHSGVLDRYTTGLPSGDAAMGFPKWVYSYRVLDVHALST